MHHISYIQISSTFLCVSECLRKSCCNPCRARKYFCKSRAEVIRAQRWWRCWSCRGSFPNCFVPCSPAETQGYSSLSWGVFMLERKKEAAHLDYLIYEGGCDAVACGRASRPGEVSPADRAFSDSPIPGLALLWRRFAWQEKGVPIAPPRETTCSFASAECAAFFFSQNPLFSMEPSPREGVKSFLPGQAWVHFSGV